MNNDDHTYFDETAELSPAEFFGDEDDELEVPAGDPEGEQEEPSAEEGGEAEEAEAEAAAEEGQQPAEELFELPSGTESRQVTRAELLALASRGQQADSLQRELDEVRQQLSGSLQQRHDAEDLAELARDAGLEVSSLLDLMKENLLVQQTGMNRDAAKAEVKKQRDAKEATRQAAREEATKAEAQRKEMRERAARDLADFKRLYPTVDMRDPKQVPQAVWNEVYSGKETLTNAYGKYLQQQQAAEIKRLTEAAAATAKNEKNRKQAVGSVRTSGRVRGQDPFLDGFDQD